jgi:uncharacterized Rmd1/YagE family protein
LITYQKTKNKKEIKDNILDRPELTWVNPSNVQLWS